MTAVKPRRAFPVHDAALSVIGKGMVNGRLEGLSKTAAAPSSSCSSRASPPTSDRRSCPIRQRLRQRITSMKLVPEQPWRAVGAGLAATAAGIGLAELVAAIISPRSSPITTVASLVIDLSPKWVKDLVIAPVRHRRQDRARRHPRHRARGRRRARRARSKLASRRGAGSCSLLGGIIAADRRDDPERCGPVRLHPGRCRRDRRDRAARRAREAAACGSPARTTGSPGARSSAGPVSPPRRAWSRRPPAASISAGADAVEAVRTAFDAPCARRDGAARPGRSRPRRPTASRRCSRPNGSFYRIDTALQVPVIDPADWTLKITGMVDEPLELTWDELIALPLEESATTIACVSNYVGRRPDRQRAVARLPDPPPARAGEAEGGRRHGALAQHRRVHRIHSDRGAAG